MTPEGRTKKRITAMLKDVDVYYFMPVQFGYGEDTVDYLGCRRDGQMFAIEAKRHLGDPTDRQKATLKRMREHGCQTFVCDDESDHLIPKHCSIVMIKIWLTTI